MQWWGDFEFESGEQRRWQIGPLNLWISRVDNEWRVVNSWSGDPLDPALVIAEPFAEDEEPAPSLERRRYLFAEEGRLRILPRVADRPMVTRPEMPVILPAGQRATLYLATPLWVELSLLSSSGAALVFAEIPTWKASSTWYGENTLEGNLYYATRTRARLSLPETPGPGPRVITCMQVANNHGEPLRIERIALPLPQMSVFRDENSALWTEAATVDYEPTGNSPVQLQQKPQQALGATTLVSGSREDRSSNIIVRALSAALRGLMP
ncbi:MAG: hypothetical protein KC431_01375 [Myxococcales bacterium]|nr:hypothetical protein [Myxococcales bacterium]